MAATATSMAANGPLLCAPLAILIGAFFFMNLA
jgi:hypothetical protein